MSKTSKLKLILELGNKLFNNKLMQTKRKLNKATDKMKGKLKNLKISTIDAFSSMRAEIPLFGRAMDLLGNPYTLLAAGLFSVVSLFGKATIEAKKFNHEFLSIQNLNLDKNNKDLKIYKGLIMDTSFATGRGLTESTKAYYDIQSATGLYGKEAKKVFTSVANYSTATGAQLNSSVNSTTKAMKAFNLEADQTKMLLESNAKAVQTGITTFDELARVQTQFGGSAGNIGQSVDTANKLFASFTAIGGTVAEASTLTKTFFQGLAQRGKQIEKHTGVKVFDADGNFRQADKILGDIGKRFENLSQNQVANVISKIGGPDGLNQMLFKMKGNAGDVLKTFESFDSSKFDLSKALKNAQADTTILGQMARNKFNVIMAKLGEKILPIVNAILIKINAVLGWVYNNFDLLEDIVESLAIGFGVLGARLLLFKGIAIASSIASVGLSGALGLVSGALHAIKLAIFSIPIVGWILAGVTALVLMYKRWDKFRAVIHGIGAVLKEFFSNLWKGFKQVIGGIVDGFGAMGKIIKSAIKLDWEGMKEGANDYRNAIGKVVSGASSFIPTIDAHKNGKAYGKAFKNAYQLEMERSKKAKQEKETNNPFATNSAFTNSGNETDGGNIGNPDYGISKVTSQANAPKSIIIEKIVFNEGGINTQNTTLQNMDTDEMDAWFNEMGMRLVRNIEMS